jgi:quercetin dioxygenase-like cupin family protein
MTTPDMSGRSGAERLEAIGRPDSSRAVRIVPGVVLCPLGHADERWENLLTCLLTIEPVSRYPYYTRPFAEALTLLQGEAAVDVEDRRHHLEHHDTVLLPREVPRRVVNLSIERPAVFHVAVAAGLLDQTWVNARYDLREQAVDSIGRVNRERLCRVARGDVIDLAPRARFHAFAHAEPGTLGLAGGIGYFEPGARLPCHRVDLDGVVTVIEGTATCIVEGRRHELSDNAALFVPRGLCHYAINLTLDPLVLLWVHAGDRAERIVVDESLCHPERRRVHAQGPGEQK